MTGTIRIARVFGFEINVHWSWILIFFLFTWTFATGILNDYYPHWTESRRWVVGGGVAVIFFISILLHEMSHSLLARRFGIPVNSITLFVFGGVSNLSKEPSSAGQEFWIAIVGPLTSIALAGALGIAYLGLHGVERGAAGVCEYLAATNLLLGVFNLIPGFPLDGGRVLRSLFWLRKRNLLDATRLASRVGVLAAYAMIGAGLLMTVLLDPVSGIWLILIGNFLRGASAASYDQMFMDQVLRGVPASAVARQDYVGVPPDMTLAQLVEEHVLAGHGRAFPVLAGEQLLGLVTLSDLRHVPREDWPATTVYRAMTPVSNLRTADAKDDLPKVLAMMGTADVAQIPLVDGRLLVGLIHRGDVMHYIQTRQQIASGAATPRP